jgi:hypothetical protein
MLLAFPSINDLPAQERLLLMEGLVESAMAENAVITQLHTECLTALRTVRREVWRFGGGGEKCPIEYSVLCCYSWLCGCFVAERANL